MEYEYPHQLRGTIDKQVERIIEGMTRSPLSSEFWLNLPHEIRHLKNWCLPLLSLLGNSPNTFIPTPSLFTKCTQSKQHYEEPTYREE